MIRQFCVGTFLMAAAWAQAPVITSGGVVNGASGLAGIASGSWVTIFGTNLSSTTRLWTGADFVNGRLPLSLDGVSVKINNRDAAVYFVSPAQVNALALADAATGAVSVTVTTARGASAAVTATYQAYAPAFFTFDPQNHIYPAAVHPNGALVGRAGLFGTAATSTAPAPGDRILLYGTGFGPTTPVMDPSVTVQGAAPLTAPNDLSITVGGQKATVEYAGLTGNGLYQFNIVVPNVADGDQTLVASIGGRQTQSTLRLTVLSRPKPSIKYPGPTQQDALGCPGSGCLGVVTVSPGEQVDFWVAGTNLSSVTGIQFVPPEGIAVNLLETSGTAVHALLTIAPTAATGDRKFTVTSAEEESNLSLGGLNISTFRISNMRITNVTNLSSTLKFTVTVDYADPTGAASTGEFLTSTVLNFGNNVIIGSGYTTPEGRTPGAARGEITLNRSYSGLSGTTGALFSLTLYLGERKSDRLRVSF